MSVDVAAILDQISRLSASVANKTAVFYSPTASNSRNANLCVGADRDNSRFYMIQNTAVGKYLLNTVQINNLLATAQISQADYDLIWSMASRRFAQQASGGVIAFVDGVVSPTSIWMTEELPALLRGGVTSINGVPVSSLDPTNLAAVMALIGPQSQCFDPNDPNNPPPAPATVLTPNQIRQLQQEQGPIGSGQSAPVPDDSSTLTGTELAVAVAIAIAVVGIAFFPELLIGVAARVALGMLVAAAATTAAAGADSFAQTGDNDSNTSDKVGTDVAFLKVAADVADGKVPPSELQQFQSNDYQIADLRNLASSGNIPTANIEGIDGTTDTATIHLANSGDLTYQEHTSGGDLTLNATLASNFDFKLVGGDEGTLLYDASSSADHAFLRKQADGTVIFGWTDGRQVTLATDGTYTFKFSDGSTVSLGGSGALPDSLDSDTRSRIDTLLSGVGAVLSQHYPNQISQIVSDFLVKASGTFTITGPAGNNIVVGMSNNTELSTNVAGIEVVGGDNVTFTTSQQNTRIVLLGTHDTAIVTDPKIDIIALGDQDTLGDTAEVHTTDKTAIHIMSSATDIQGGAVNIDHIAKVYTSDADVTVDGNGHADVFLGNGNDTLLHAGAGSIINLGTGQDKIAISNDILVIGATANDIIASANGHVEHGAVGSLNSESGWIVGPDGVRYGLDTQGDLEIKDALGGITTVTGYQGGYNVGLSQQTAGIFVGRAAVNAYRLLEPKPEKPFDNIETTFKFGRALWFTES